MRFLTTGKFQVMEFQTVLNRFEKDSIKVTEELHKVLRRIKSGSFDGVRSISVGNQASLREFPGVTEGFWRDFSEISKSSSMDFQGDFRRISWVYQKKFGKY